MAANQDIGKAAPTFWILPADSDLVPLSRDCRSADGSLHARGGQAQNHADCRLHSGKRAATGCNEFARRIRTVCVVEHPPTAWAGARSAGPVPGGEATQGPALLWLPSSCIALLDLTLTGVSCPAAEQSNTH